MISVCSKHRIASVIHGGQWVMVRDTHVQSQDDARRYGKVNWWFVRIQDFPYPPCGGSPDPFPLLPTATQPNPPTRC